jgi:uncharacterized repeat protein (TIGR03803 family)
LNKDGSDYSVLHNFGNGLDGQQPVGILVEDKNGAFYGTTQNGGTADAGTVFKLGRSGQDYQVLHAFSMNADGAQPQAGLLLASNGALYGTSYQGWHETNFLGYGTVFRLNADGNGFGVVHRFQFIASVGSPGGNSPAAELIEGAAGALYGTAEQGGDDGLGTVFKVDKSGQNFSVVHNFEPDGSDASGPEAGLTEGTDGAFYGTTLVGGASNGGTVFKVNKDGSGYSILHSFKVDYATGEPNEPVAKVLEASDGILYGIASNTGDWDPRPGAIFKLNKDGSGFVVLYRFKLALDDNDPPGTTPTGRPRSAALAEGPDGALYGTAPFGGTNLAGIIFKLGKDGSLPTVLHNFGSEGDGAWPWAGLALGTDGMLYGTTGGGGTNNNGTVYGIAADGSHYRILHHFGSALAGQGQNPWSRLIEGDDGALYGTTSPTQTGAVRCSGSGRKVPDFRPCSTFMTWTIRPNLSKAATGFCTQ